MVIAAAVAADDCTVGFVAGVFQGNIAGFVRLDNMHEGFSDCLVYSKQSYQSCFVEIIHCRYGP